MNTADATQLATLLIDTYAAANEAQNTKTRSTIEARNFGHIEGTYTGVVRYAELVCKAHGRRIDNKVRVAHRRQDTEARILPSDAPGFYDDAVKTLAADLIALAERTTCEDRILWRDEDVAMARKDLAPFRCLRAPGHNGACEMHPAVAAIRDAGGTPTHEDYTAPVQP